jgi:hypothetical protein
MKSHLIGVEHAPEEILATPEGTKYFGAGKGCVEEYPDLGHGYTTREEGGEDHEMKSMDPYEISLVEALNDDIGEISIDCGEGRPQFGFSASVSVNGTLSHVVHAVFGVFGIVVGFGLFVGIAVVLGFCVDSRGTGVYIGNVV